MSDDVVLPDHVLRGVNAVLAGTRKQLANIGEELLPLAHAFVGEKSVIMGFMFRNQSEKETCAKAIKDFAVGLDADLLILRIESWSLALKSIDEIREYQVQRALGMWPELKAHPKAIEVIYLLVETKTESWAGMGTLVKNGSRRILGPIKWGVNPDGLFSGLLKKEAV